MEDTPEQQNSMKAWAVRRDEILRDIAQLKVEQGQIIASNIDGNEAFSEVQGRITHTIGRLDELDRLEETKKTTVSKDIADLQSIKTNLETDISGKKALIGELDTRFNLLTTTIATLVDVHDKVFDKTSIMEEMVGHVTRLSQENIVDLNTYFGKLKASIQEIVDKNSLNVEQTNIVLSKIHKYIFELQKPIPIKRVKEK